MQYLVTNSNNEAKERKMEKGMWMMMMMTDK